MTRLGRADHGARNPADLGKPFLGQAPMLPPDSERILPGGSALDDLERNQLVEAALKTALGNVVGFHAGYEKLGVSCRSSPGGMYELSHRFNRHFARKC